jgi:putative transposase
MISWMRLVVAWICFFGRERMDLVLEVLTLRQQVLILQRTHPRPRLTRADRVFWTFLSSVWGDWKRSLILFQPKTVVGWQRKSFCWFWRWKSHRQAGRPQLAPETVALIRSMWRENPLWGAPKIERELLKLGIRVSQSTIQKYQPRDKTPRGQRWMTFLRNHLRSVVAVDFFTVPTVTFRVLYVFIILHHERRRVLHFNITESPTAAWTGQQMVNAFPFVAAPPYVLRDRDGIYGEELQGRIRNLGMEELKITSRSPWQSPYVERMIGTLRRGCLDHMIIFNERQLHRVLREFLDYYHRVRPHRSLDDDSPDGREVEEDVREKIVALPVLGGLHHHYTRRAA